MKKKINLDKIHVKSFVTGQDQRGGAPSTLGVHVTDCCPNPTIGQFQTDCCNPTIAQYQTDCCNPTIGQYVTDCC
jgi:hypothetical protein